MDRGDVVKARVRIRRELGEVKVGAEQIDGEIFEFTAGWIIEKDKKDSDLYIGEWAMLPSYGKYPHDAPIWIASGDLEILGE